MSADKEKIRVGISSCLLGERVRYNGDHKEDRFITGTLSQFFEWVPVCPEVDIELGVPRETLRLEGDLISPRMITGKTRIDYTDRMNKYARKKTTALKRLGLDGYILKKDSPSCGMERVRVYKGPDGPPERKGVGLFARALMDKMPDLPVEEEGRLNDPQLRENFIVRLFCHHRWQKLTDRRFKASEIVEFHTKHKLLLMAHSEVHMRQLGKLVAEVKTFTPAELKTQYGSLFFEALRRKATIRKHTNVMQHIIGYFKNDIGDQDKKELLTAIEDYRQGLLPLIVPITLIRHYVNKFDIQYVQNQVYLYPHPKELMLLNHV